MGQATQSGKSRRAERIRCWAHSEPPVRIFNQSVTTTTGDSATGNESLQVGAWFGADIWLNRIQGSRRQREAAHPKGRRRSDNSCPPGSKCTQHDQALKSAAAPLEELALALAMSPSQSAERETPLAMTDGHGSRWYRADRSRGEPLRGTGWKMHPASPAEARRGHQQRASSTVWEKSRRLGLEPLFLRARGERWTQVRARRRKSFGCGHCQLQSHLEPAGGVGGKGAKVARAKMPSPSENTASTTGPAG